MELREKLEKMLPETCEITACEMVPAGDPASLPGMPVKDVPAHVQVCVTARPEAGSHIRMEVWLPTEGWNRDLAGIGNGGAAGTILPMMLVSPLRLGFAAMTTDMGTSAEADCSIGNRAVWTDFGHRATHIMALVGKAAVEAYYGKPARHSYFVGGSTGGQQALSEAQRYPEDFDGICACAPAYDRVNLHLAFLNDWLKLNHSGSEPFTAEDEAKLVRRFLDVCGLAGERHEGDDFFYRPDRIRVTKEMLDGLGFSEKQLDALMAVYEGTSFYEATLTPGSEQSGFGLAHRCETDSFAQGYFYLFRWLLGADFDFTNFDFEKDGAALRRELSPELDAARTDLSAFRDRGGKLLLVHGTADPIIPMSSSIRYFKDVQKMMGDTADFFRLFLLPGMGHVSGGPGVQDYVYGMPATPKDEKHLALLTLKAWVEEGKAPDTIWPVAFKKDNPLSAFGPDGVAYEREVKSYEEGA